MNLSAQLAVAYFAKPLTLRVQLPRDRPGMASTVLLLADRLLEEEDLPEDYLSHLRPVLRRVNQLLISQEMAASHPELVVQLLSLWLAVT
jgi:hypothetical protein